MIKSIVIRHMQDSQYLGGMAALNLPSEQGTGDWHMNSVFFIPREKRSLSFVSGVGCPTNTISLLGLTGIYDCTRLLDELKIQHEDEVVYAANHARAIVDLVLSSIFRGGTPSFVILDEWMPRDCDKQAVFDLIDLVFEKLTLNQQQKLTAWKINNSCKF